MHTNCIRILYNQGKYNDKTENHVQSLNRYIKLYYLLNPFYLISP